MTMKFAMKCFDKTSKYAIFLSNAGQQNAPIQSNIYLIFFF